MTALSSTERFRCRYMPDDVRVLFACESPPSGPAFLYNGNSKLFRATQEAFGRTVPALAKLEAHAFLDEFERAASSMTSASSP